MLVGVGVMLVVGGGGAVGVVVVGWGCCWGVVVGWAGGGAGGGGWGAVGVVVMVGVVGVVGVGGWWWTNVVHQQVQLLLFQYTHVCAGTCVCPSWSVMHHMSPWKH